MIAMADGIKKGEPISSPFFSPAMPPVSAANAYFEAKQ